MRQIRVKPSNQAAIMAALIKAGFTATPCEAPLSQEEYEMNAFNDFQNWSEDSIQNMTGIETNASGHQAHKVICALKAENISINKNKKHMTATFVLLMGNGIETNHLFKVSSFEDAYNQVKEHLKELDVPATLLSLSVSSPS